MRRRHLVQGLLAGILVSTSARAAARCAPLSVRQDARQSRYVFEGVIESVSDNDVVFRVVAVWKGNPPAQARVQFSWRSSLSASSVGQTYLVFARGDSDDALSCARCGGTGPLDAARTAELTASHLTRRARP